MNRQPMIGVYLFVYIYILSQSVYTNSRHFSGSDRSGRCLPDPYLYHHKWLMVSDDTYSRQHFFYRQF